MAEGRQFGKTSHKMIYKPDSNQQPGGLQLSALMTHSTMIKIININVSAVIIEHRNDCN